MNKDGNKNKKMNKNQLFSWAFLVSFLIVYLLFKIPGIQIYEWNLADKWARTNYGKTVSKDVAVIGIDDDFFNIHGFDWPLNRDLYGEMIAYLKIMGAEVIAFDFDFSHDIKVVGHSDTLFLSMVEMFPEVVIGYGFVVQEKKEVGPGTAIGAVSSLRSESVQEHIDERFAVGKGHVPLLNYSAVGAEVPYPKLHEKMQSAGFFNRSPQMIDGVDRWMPLMIEQDSLIFTSLALSSVQQLLKDSAEFIPEKREVHLGTRKWRVNNQTDMLVDFTDSIPVYTMSDIFLSMQDYLKYGKTPEIGEEELKGRIILVGIYTLSDGDLGINPVSSLNDASKYNGKTPMVMLHAYSANTLLHENDFWYWGRVGAIGVMVASLLLLFVLFRFLPQKILNIVIPFVFIAIYFLGYGLYSNHIFLPVVEALAASIIFTIAGVSINYYENNSEYRYISSVFRTYISPELIDEMVRTHTMPKLGGERIGGTAFFTDIEKFSTFSEQFTPEELIMVLNEYFSDMTRLLKENKGTLDKFIGDAIVAIFGAPLHYEEHAYYACNAAWQMQATLAELRKRWKENPAMKGKVDNMRMRIGINSGDFIVGNMGSSDRMNYTMIGDTVNLAARLESGAKQYGVYTMVGESTYEFTKKHFLFRCIDRIVVVGRSKPVSVYELMAPLDLVTEEIEKCHALYSKGTTSYFSGDFETALLHFTEAQEYELSDKKVTPSSVMAQRCTVLIENPPATWDGVYTMQSK